MSNLRIQAEAAASRVDPDEVGLDPVLILTIITMVLPFLADCFRRNDENDAEEVKAAVVRANERNPRQLLRRTTTAVMRQDRSLSRSQASVLAEAIIEQAIESTSQAVAACMMEVAD